MARPKSPPATPSVAIGPGAGHDRDTGARGQMGYRQYVGYCLAVSLALIFLKLSVGSYVPASALMADDHEYLNRSIYVVRGDLRLTGYPFSPIEYGPLYPLVLSPWMLFAHPSTRFTVVFAINAILSATAVFLGSLIVFRLTQVGSLLVPLCLASFAPLFQFSFYAMSENLLFPLLLFVGWLIVDFEQTCNSAPKSIVLVLVALLLPLVRVPGLAVAPALPLLVWINRKRIPRRVSAAFVAGLTILVTASYLVAYRVVIQSRREESYLSSLWALLSDVNRWLFPLKLALSQIGYLFVSTGYWVLPVLIVLGLQVRSGLEEAHRQRWINYLTYAAVAGGAFICFALVHLIQKLNVNEAGFIYGRYSDPTGLLLLVGGLAGVLALKPLTDFQRLLLQVAAPVALAWALGGVVGQDWTPVNQCGLSIFAMGMAPLRWLLLGSVLATLVNQLADRTRWYAPLALTFFLVFSLVSDRQGMAYTTLRAERVAYSFEASEWIAAHAPIEARIGYDASVLKMRVPGMPFRTMDYVYSGMMFRTYPRPSVLVDSTQKLATVDYVYSLLPPTWEEKEEGKSLERVWYNRAYVLYRVKRPSGATARPDT